MHGNRHSRVVLAGIHEKVASHIECMDWIPATNTRE
jgi:hypothetical protein